MVLEGLLVFASSTLSGKALQPSSMMILKRWYRQASHGLRSSKTYFQVPKTPSHQEVLGPFGVVSDTRLHLRRPSSN